MKKKRTPEEQRQLDTKHVKALNDVKAASEYTKKHEAKCKHEHPDEDDFLATLTVDNEQLVVAPRTELLSMLGEDGLERTLALYPILAMPAGRYPPERDNTTCLWVVVVWPGREDMCVLRWFTYPLTKGGDA